MELAIVILIALWVGCKFWEHWEYVRDLDETQENKQ
jgi:hypothetical protein